MGCGCQPGAGSLRPAIGERLTSRKGRTGMSKKRNKGTISKQFHALFLPGDNNHANDDAYFIESYDDYMSFYVKCLE